jgi:DNA-binding LacI/PurR family transcriptional regulator
VRQPVNGQALDVTTRLLATLASGEQPNSAATANASDVVLPTEIIVRGSTDPTRTVY